MLAHSIIDKIFMRFPTLKPDIMEIISSVLIEERDHAKYVVDSIIEAEQNYIFTNDLQFKEGKSNNEPVQEGQPGQPPKAVNKQKEFVKEIRERVDHYFHIVLRGVRDTIPKQVGFFLVQRSQDKLQSDLWMRISTNRKISTLLGEPAAITERRKQLSNLITCLGASMKVIQRDPE